MDAGINCWLCGKAVAREKNKIEIIIKRSGTIEETGHLCRTCETALRNKDIIIKQSCLRCNGPPWYPEKPLSEGLPLRCPDCRSPYWNKEKLR